MDDNNSLLLVAVLLPMLLMLLMLLCMSTCLTAAVGGDADAVSLQGLELSTLLVLKLAVCVCVWHTVSLDWTEIMTAEL